ncbi:MAG: hypothetical protein KGY70_20180 [Bacteroidales bacterium]|nr:hypothetical protein [Bacteroidales bacterium]
MKKRKLTKGKSLLYLIASVGIFICIAGLQVSDQKTIHIGNRRELFVDDYLIDKMNGAELRLHHPTPREVCLVTDEPWEGNTCGYFTIFQDDSLYRMYYRGSHSGEPEHREVTCYAESKDGIHWKKPNLGLHEFNGSKANNIIWDSLGTHNFTPFKDQNPDAKPEAKYKALARGKEEGQHGLFAFQSPDGIHWSLMSDEPVITKGAFDSQNLAFWDPVRKEYREYHRDFKEGIRDIRTAASDDFLHWSDPQWLEYPGAAKEHLYTNQIMPYYRAPHILLGFPTRYLGDRGSLTEGLFMSSLDRRTFKRRPEAFIRPGLLPGKWQNRSNYIWWGLVETESPYPGGADQLSLYVNEGYYEGKSSRIRRYTLRIDGFVSLSAPMEGGEMVTKPVIFSGDQLEINFSTSAAGSLKVELQDENGKPIPGFTLDDCPEIYGDAIERTVEWNSNADLSKLAGKPVRMRFVLKDADLYSFRFQE